MVENLGRNALILVRVVLTVILIGPFLVPTPPLQEGSSEFMDAATVFLNKLML